MSRRALEFARAPVTGTLVIRGALARGTRVAGLVDRLRCDDDDTLARLRVVVVADVAVVLGPEDALPWIDGLTYVAPHPDEPSLWLPTDAAIDIDASVVLRAFLGRPERPQPPLLLDPYDRTCISLSAATQLDRTRLGRLREACHG